MGFHGYEHEYSLFGDCGTVDCPQGPERHYHEPELVTANHESRQRYPNRIKVRGHPNDGPVDLSKFHTPTGRGTWSIGGQPARTQALPKMQIQSSTNQFCTNTLYPTLFKGDSAPLRQRPIDSDATPSYSTDPATSIGLPMMVLQQDSGSGERLQGTMEGLRRTGLTRPPINSISSAQSGWTSSSGDPGSISLSEGSNCLLNSTDESDQDGQEVGNNGRSV